MEAVKAVVPFCTAANNFYDRRIEDRQEKLRRWRGGKFLYKRLNAGVHQGTINELCVEYRQRLQNAFKRQKCSFAISVLIKNLMIVGNWSQNIYA
jgi:hypothetical protein